MRFLLYNWVPFDDPERRGGGVRVYQKNLVDYLVHHTEHDVVAVASGLEHDIIDRSFRIEETQNEYPGRVRSFSIVNSPVMAPGQHAFGSPEVFDESTLPHWHEFLGSLGPVDIVQFDTLEGIPIPFVRVHEVLPDAHVGVYLHNYYPVCPQVNLWKREAEHCADYHDGFDCASCLLHEVRPTEVLRAHQVSRVLRRAGVSPEGVTYKLAYRVYGRLRANRERAGKLRRLVAQKVLDTPAPAHLANTNATEDMELRLPVPDPDHTLPVSLKTGSAAAAGDKFSFRREQAAALVNREADVILATSRRVAEVAGARGLDRAKTELAYIGTRVADEVDRSRRRHELAVPGELTMAYLGYMRRDKGFYFLVDALERTQDELLSRLRLVIGAKMADPQMERRLEALSGRMRDILHINGYEHDELPSLLRGVDVGLVPVQWEDNLPQVAIEMVANGLPLVTSNRGGAQELGGTNSDFVFEATNRADFMRVLSRLADGEVSLDDYWADAVELVNMDMHYRRLTDLYRSAGSTSAANG
ncbi:MAG TPA: glycosyltransferase [Marmoricola sp.]|jgi:glycosyltransferase involved in cell wall biosynthesis|nr:glycosyltransferase [Marmoricola sp.]